MEKVPIRHIYRPPFNGCRVWLLAMVPAPIGWWLKPALIRGMCSPLWVELMTYRNTWFCGRDSLRQLPGECVADCSGWGDRTEPVRAWVRRLEFDGPAWLIRRHLKRYGCWDAADLCNHPANLERLLWLWACAAWQDPDAAGFLYLEG
jgi:hypothetical protein